MDQKEFEKKFKKVKVDKRKKSPIPAVAKKAYDYTKYDTMFPEGFRMIIVAEEEFSEAIKEASKFLRQKGDKMHLIEELADASICIEFLKTACGISDNDLVKAIAVKTGELERRLNEGTWK